MKVPPKDPKYIDFGFEWKWPVLKFRPLAGIIKTLRKWFGRNQTCWYTK